MASDTQPSAASPGRTTGVSANRCNLGVIAGSALVVAILGWRHRGLSDDGLIFLRTVRQILAGNGPVVNVGERSEANTSTLWQWILVAAGWVTPADLGFTAVVGGLVLTTLGVGVALDATRRLHTPDGSRLLLPAGVLVLFGVPPFWDYTTTGLDSGLGVCWLAGCWWLLVHVAEGRERLSGRRRRAGARFLGSSVWIGLGPLVRPELAIASAVFLAALTVVLQDGAWRFAARVAASVALPVGYEIFRAGYYGILVPMPGVAKEAGASDPGRGLDYVVDFVEPYALYVPALLTVSLLAVLVARSSDDAAPTLAALTPPARTPSAPIPFGRERWRRLAVPLAPVLTAILLTGYVVWVGGDFMHARMLLAPMFLMLMPVLLVPFEFRTALAVTALATWAVAVAGPWNPDAYQDNGGDTTVLIRTSDENLTGMLHPDHTHHWVDAFGIITAAVDVGTAAPEPTLVVFDKEMRRFHTMPLATHLADDVRISVQGGFLGVTGAAVPLHERIVEYWGLANTVAAHLEPGASWRNMPGHRKGLGYTWMIAMEARPGAPLPPWGYPELDPRAIAAARHALSCGDLKELLDSTREPLTLGRFVDNLFGAPGRTSLVIPRDPFEAERKFCGTR